VSAPAPGPRAAVQGPTAGAPETAAVRSMFDRIAPSYDLLNRLLSAGIDARWRRAAIRDLGLTPGGAVLDLCTGTADLLIEQLGRDRTSRGVGLDLSEQMLRRGRDKLERRGCEARAALLSADAVRLPFGADQFDGALVAFGIRNVGRPSEALYEVLRVLRPGARLVVLEFAMPAQPLAAVYKLYFRHVLPRVGGLVSGDRAAYEYLPRSVERFATAGELRALLDECGFVRLRQRRLSGGIAYLTSGERSA